MSDDIPQQTSAHVRDNEDAENRRKREEEEKKEKEDRFKNIEVDLKNDLAKSIVDLLHSEENIRLNSDDVARGITIHTPSDFTVDKPTIMAWVNSEIRKREDFSVDEFASRNWDEIKGVDCVKRHISPHNGLEFDFELHI